MTDNELRDKAYLIATGHHLIESFNYEDYQSIDISLYIWDLVADWPIILKSKSSTSNTKGKR